MRVRTVLFESRFILLASVLLSGAAAALTLLLLYEINTLVNDATRAGFERLGRGAAILASLLLVNTGSQLLLARFGAGSVAKIRTTLATQLLEVEYERLIHRNRLLVVSLVEDMGRVVQLLLLAPQIAYSMTLAVIILGYLSHISLALFGVLLAFIAAAVWVTVEIARRARSYFDASRQAEEAVFECFRAICEGKKELSLGKGRQRHFTAEMVQPGISAACRQMTRAHVSVGVHNAWVQAVVYGAMFCVAWLGSAVLSLPLVTVAHFVITALFLVSPVSFLTGACQQIAPGGASLRRLEHLGVELGAEIGRSAPSLSRPAASQDDWRYMRVAGARYRYPAEAGTGYELGPLELRINRGEMIFLTGGNGSGKSTLLLLLCGLLRPTAGDLLLDGRSVLNDMPGYRARFSGVFYDFFLFKHVLDHRGQCLADADIEAQLRLLGLASKVRSERGELSNLSLSAGQRRRLAFLQCCAENADIYFFDEWAADQDAQSRERFYRVLLPALRQQGKTLIVVSHDERYFDVADRVIKLEAGRIVEDSPSAVPAQRAAVAAD